MGVGAPGSERWPHFQVAECGKAPSEHLQEMGESEGQGEEHPCADWDPSTIPSLQHPETQAWELCF